MSEPPTTSFGLREVSEGERQGLVNDVFAKVADRYDLMNDLMSGGLHRLWKDDLVGWLAPPRGQAAYAHLDVAGGTGDVALRVMRAAGTGASSVICDISGEMLGAGQRRIAKTEQAARIALVQGNAEALPFPGGTFNAYTIAFGIRNVTHIDTALAEAFRVLRPGGRFLCLECAGDGEQQHQAYDSRVVSSIHEPILTSRRQCRCWSGHAIVRTLRVKTMASKNVDAR